MLLPRGTDARLHEVGECVQGWGRQGPWDFSLEKCDKREKKNGIRVISHQIKKGFSWIFCKASLVFSVLDEKQAPVDARGETVSLSL